MSEDVEVSITGLSELQTALENLAGKEAKAIVRDGLSQGGDTLREEMMDECSRDLKGEPSTVAGQKSSWSKSTRMGDELSGTTRVAPKGKLVRLHKALHHKVWHKGMQPFGAFYFRSLNYLLRLAEFGAQGGKERGLIPRSAPMTRGFEGGKGRVLDKVVAVIRERLHLE